MLNTWVPLLFVWVCMRWQNSLFFQFIFLLLISLSLLILRLNKNTFANMHARMECVLWKAAVYNECFNFHVTFRNAQMCICRVQSWLGNEFISLFIFEMLFLTNALFVFFHSHFPTILVISVCVSFVLWKFPFCRWCSWTCLRYYELWCAEVSTNSYNVVATGSIFA